MADMNKIKVLLVCPNEIPKVANISNTLQTKQKLVNGQIKLCYILGDKEVCLICNENGKFDGSLPNCDIGYDIIYRNFLVVGDDYVNSDFKSLSKKQIKKYQKYFNEDDIIAKFSERIDKDILIFYLAYILII